MINITEEQSINSSMTLCETGIRAAFRFGRWLVKYSLDKSAKSHAINRELENACSAFRGGFADSDSEAARELINDLSGTQDARLDGSFFFVGDKSDLSYFWKKNDANNSAPLLRQYIEDIPDESLRNKVISTLSKSHVDGLTDFDGKAYTLTDKGRLAIFNSDFVVQRLNTECKILGIAGESLKTRSDELRQRRIDARLKELGLDGSFNNHDVITVNKGKLLKEINENGTYSFFIPKTNRNGVFNISKEYVIELDGKTYAVFLDKNAEYSVQANGKEYTVSEEQLFKYFDDKNALFTERAPRAMELAQTEAKWEHVLKSDLPMEHKKAAAEDTASKMGNFNEDDFMALAMKRSYTDALSEAGNEYTVFLKDGTEIECEVTRTWHDIDGVKHYNLTSIDGSYQDVLIPEDAVGSIAFSSPAEGRAFISEHPDVFSEYQEILSVQTDGSESRTVYSINKNAWTEHDNDYLINSAASKYEKVEVPKHNGVKQDDDSLMLCIDRSNNYRVTSGKYSYEVTGKGAEKVIGKNAHIVVGKEAAQAIKATQTVAAAIPPVEGVSAAAKTAMHAVSTIAQGASQTYSFSRKL